MPTAMPPATNRRTTAQPAAKPRPSASLPPRTAEEAADDATDAIAGDDGTDSETEGGEPDGGIGGPFVVADLAVLLTPIDPVDSVEELADALRARLTTGQLGAPFNELGAGRSAVADAVASLDLVLDTCAELYADEAALALGAPDAPSGALDVDELVPIAVGIVVVDGDDWVVVLLDDPASADFVALAAPAASCEPVAVLPVDG